MTKNGCRGRGREKTVKGTAGLKGSWVGVRDCRGKSAGGSLLLEFSKRIVLSTQTLALLSRSSLCVPSSGAAATGDLTNGENQCREGGGRSTPLLSSFPRSKPQKGCLKKSRESRSSQSRLTLSLHFFAFSAVGRLNNDCGVGGGGESTQSATFRERVMVMMSMMAAGEPLEGEIEKKEGGGKTLQSSERSLLSWLSLSDSLVFHSAFN